jgi:hypothetical protein
MMKSKMGTSGGMKSKMAPTGGKKKAPMPMVKPKPKKK